MTSGPMALARRFVYFPQSASHLSMPATVIALQQDGEYRLHVALYHSVHSSRPAHPGMHRPQVSARGSMRPPPRPNVHIPTFMNGRAQSPADPSSAGRVRTKSPGAPANPGIKRKERDFDQDAGEETNINVVVRCRGRSEREVRENSGVVVSANGVKGTNVELSMGPNAISNKTYNFDRVFSPAADQAIIYEDVVAPILNEMLTGFNCTIFAYGQTGTGKTYTMSGDMTDTLGLLSDAAGIIPRVLYALFQKLEADDLECSVKCSFIELYNEELRDLLSADESAKLKIYDDASKKSHTATMVQGMEESHIKNATAGIKLLQEGSHRRQVAATKCNDLSSRSHTVFTITTYIKKLTDGGEDYICSGKLNLVDLAGSENIQRSGAENKRAVEAGLINKSLLTLGRVINALVDKSSHIPYRESKLTRLLQDSLGGRTKTCIIATVSPAKSNLEETISTLDYAFRAKNIRNKPQVNSMISKKTLLREFTAEIEKLKSELIATRQRNGVYLSNEQYEEMTVESESRRILSEEQKARIETMEASLRNKVQDLFNLTNNFQVLKRDNEATRTAMDNTRDLLLKTEIVLRDTRESLAEEVTIREAHQTTEQSLFAAGTTLVSTLHATVGDLGGTHAKLRRRSELHNQNRVIWQNTISEVVSVADLVSSRTEAFDQAQARVIASISGHINDFVTSEVQSITQNQAYLESCIVEHASKKIDLVKQDSQATDSLNEVLEEIKVLREEVKAKVTEGLKGLSAAAETISGEVISELEDFHSQLHTSYSTLGREFKNIFDDMAKDLAAQRTEADRLRQQLQEANIRSLGASRAASEQLRSSLEHERQASLDDKNILMAQIAALLDSSERSRDARVNSSIAKAQSQLEESQRALITANEEYQDGSDKWITQDQALQERVVNSREELKAKMKKDWTAINVHNTAIQSSTKAAHQETLRIVDVQLNNMANQMATLDEFVTRARSVNGNRHDGHVQRLESFSVACQHSFNECVQHLATSRTNVQSLATDSQAIFSDAASSITQLSQTVQQPLDILRAELTKSTMVDYVATGDTPQKKEWQYPTVLPQTEVRESIIARMRGLSDPAAKTPMSRAPARSPRKLASPRKVKSPSKIPSPNKTRVFADPKNIPATYDCSVTAPTGVETVHGGKPGLKEIDMNIARPSSAEAFEPCHSRPGSVFAKSVGSGQQPPLKRHASSFEVTAMSKVPAKLGASKTRASTMIAESRENTTVLSQSVGPGTGRRLRSSPPE